MVIRILFVCTGNTCRSPIAEHLMRSKAAHAGVAIEVDSAGVAAAEGIPISEHASIVLKNRGIESHEKRAKSVSEKLLQWADVVLTMTMAHKERLIQMFPDAMDHIYTLKEYAQENHSNRHEAKALEQELQMKLAMSKPITEDEKKQLSELVHAFMAEDVLDPFGGSVEVYEETAQELDALLDRVLERLKKESGQARQED